MSNKRRVREDPCLVCGHFHTEQCHICGHILTTHERRHVETVMPTAIISGELYMGSYDTASRSEILKTMGITHILNTVPTCPCLFKNTFTYHTTSTSPPDFQECFEFIDAAVSTQQNKVLVYCMSGISRSATIVIGYLMKHRGWRLAESYKWVKSKRASVNISTGDTARLQELELLLHKSSSAPFGFGAVEGALSLSAVGTSGSGLSTSGSGGIGQQQANSAPAFGGETTQWNFDSGASAASFVATPAFAALGAGGGFVFGSAATPQAVVTDSNMDTGT